MIKSIFKKIWIGIAVGSVVIGIISGLMTIDSWIESKFSKGTPSITIEQKYYIDNIEVIENNGTYYKK